MVAWLAIALALAALAFTACAGYDTGSLEISGPFATGIVWHLPQLQPSNIVTNITTIP